MVRYAGVYAKGMHEPVFIELRMLGYNVIEHYHEHNVVVFASLHLEDWIDRNFTWKPPKVVIRYRDLAEASLALALV